MQKRNVRAFCGGGWRELHLPFLMGTNIGPVGGHGAEALTCKHHTSLNYLR
jgi:hypothetical protein